ncbi:MAG: hypothetical protein L0287_27710 [Anaerolineae bacterium]|nr:hypothetical protein [Anaerolineae bacterium]
MKKMAEISAMGSSFLLFDARNTGGKRKKLQQKSANLREKKDALGARHLLCGKMKEERKSVVDQLSR